MGQTGHGCIGCELKEERCYLEENPAYNRININADSIEYVPKTRLWKNTRKSQTCWSWC